MYTHTHTHTQGATGLAEAMSTGEVSLLDLDLGCNKISDEGLSALAEVC